MTTEHLELIWFVLEQAEQQPVDVRVRLYRSLAQICGSESEAKFLNALAGELERVNKKSEEFMNSLQQKFNFHHK